MLRLSKALAVLLQSNQQVNLLFVLTKTFGLDCSMRLQKARVQNYRSIRDSGWFDVESEKTILVGPNEAGKTVLLRALEKINPAAENSKFDSLRDFPRSELNNLSRSVNDGRPLSPSDVTVVEAHFTLEPSDLHAVKMIDSRFANVTTYIFGRRLDNSYWHKTVGGPPLPTYGEIRNDLSTITSLADVVILSENEEDNPDLLYSEELKHNTSGWTPSDQISDDKSLWLINFLTKMTRTIKPQNGSGHSSLTELIEIVGLSENVQSMLTTLHERLPVFVYFSSYFRVHPRIHLAQLANRIEEGSLDQNPYDFGNACLLKFLKFDARELSRSGNVPDPDYSDQQSIKDYEDQIDRRSYQLSAASKQLTDSVDEAWNPSPSEPDYDSLRITADQQYLKVVVVDDLKAEVELDQRSEGFQWLVSFFVVFFAEAEGHYKNAILLLDEPGLSLHGLKQKEFCSTITRLSKTNQLLYSTHSPFMIGTDELDFVRVVEMNDRATGTVVHSTIFADNPASLLPLQEALGYDLAQNLFIQKRNLILEGLTDYWYVDAVAKLLQEEKNTSKLNPNIALIPASSAGKIVYFATILHANNLKVAALLDSDAAGDNAAKIDTLTHILKNKNILRTKDAYTGPVKKPEIEDLLRDTLVEIADSELGWNITTPAQNHPNRSIAEILDNEVKHQTQPKYKLAKAFLRWAREHDASHLTPAELDQWNTLISNINKALK